MTSQRARSLAAAALGALAAFSVCAIAQAPPAAGTPPPGAKPGDDALTCMQIAMELQPYMARAMATMGPLAQTSQEVVARGQQRVAEATPGAVALTMAATASHADPTGIASRAVGQAETAYQASVWQRSMVEDKPLRDTFNAQAQAAVGDAQKMQSEARMQRLMQLVQEKKCDGGEPQD